MIKKEKLDSRIKAVEKNGAAQKSFKNIRGKRLSETLTRTQFYKTSDMSPYPYPQP